MGNVLYDFFPGATVTPYVGGGVGVAFVDANIQGCSLCLAMGAASRACWCRPVTACASRRTAASRS
jgi:hypothetical protein